jgi:hypothetical protein
MHALFRCAPVVAEASRLPAALPQPAGPRWERWGLVEKSRQAPQSRPCANCRGRPAPPRPAPPRTAPPRPGRPVVHFSASRCREVEARQSMRTHRAAYGFRAPPGCARIREHRSQQSACCLRAPAGSQKQRPTGRRNAFQKDERRTRARMSVNAQAHSMGRDGTRVLCAAGTAGYTV